MQLKWSIAGITFLGIVAAFCAAVLVASLRATPVRAIQVVRHEEAKVVVASRAIPAMTLIGKDDVAMTVVEKSAVPDDGFTSTVQVIGKVVSSPMVAGQAFTRAEFVGQDPGVRLAADLPPGMRAVSIELGEYSASFNLLYPGCHVDVLGSFRLTANRLKQGQAVSTTLIQDVKVLAVEDRTLYSSGEALDGQPMANRPLGARKHVVTLMVDAMQAKKLQLAMEHGNLSLAIRNPDDSTLDEDDATLLKDGQMAAFEELEQELGLAKEPPPQPPSTPLTSLFDPPEDDQPTDPPKWDTTIIRGASPMEVRSFELPEPAQER